MFCDARLLLVGKVTFSNQSDVSRAKHASRANYAIHVEHTEYLMMTCAESECECFAQFDTSTVAEQDQLML